MEVCPSCGKWAEALDEITGFCDECSPAVHSVSTLAERYLEKHADELESYLLRGRSLNQAIDALHANNGSHHRCLVCGNAIPHAPRNAVFCRAKKECRRYARRYVYLYSEKGMSKAEALAKVLGEVS